MKKSPFILLSVLMITGCYREPANPMPSSSRMDQSAKGTGMSPPNDAIHSGMGAGSTEIIESRDVVMDSMYLTAPDNWVRRKGNDFIMTEFVLPKADGDTEDGRLTVSTAGGSVEMNIDRWKGQFSGAPEKSSQEALDVNGVQMTVVDLSGTFQAGMMAPATQKPNYRMIAAIIPLDGKLFFVKAYGPEKTMDANADAIHTFLASLKPVGQKPAAGPAADAKAEPAGTAEPPAEGEAKAPATSDGEPPAAGGTEPPGDSGKVDSGGTP